MSARPLPLAELPTIPPPLPWQTAARSPARQPTRQPAGQPGSPLAAQMSAPAAGVAGAAARPTALAPRLELPALGEILDGLADAVELWRPHVRHDAHQRARVRLLHTPAYEVWLIGWLPGQTTELHDHGGSNAALVVVNGELTVSSSAGTGDGDTPAAGSAHVTPIGLPLEHQQLAAGRVLTLPAGHVHLVANRSSSPATSLHAYSRPLRSMGVFDEHDDICGHRLRTLWVDEQPSVLDSAPHC